jgi:hypothetical protein
MKEAPSRRLLATDRPFGERVRVYRTPGALEVDQIDFSGIRRRRVFFDEVQLVTLHSQRGIARLAVETGILAFLVGIAAGGLGAKGDLRSLSIFFATAAAIVLGSLVSMLIPVWTVTVFGKRTRARLRFPLRSGKARRIYGEICRAVAEAQAEAQKDAAHPSVEIAEETPS